MNCLKLNHKIKKCADKRKGSNMSQKISKKYKHSKPGKDQPTITQSLAKMGPGDMGLTESHYSSTSSVLEEESHVFYCSTLPPSKQSIQAYGATVTDEKKKPEHKSSESEQDVADFQLESQAFSKSQDKGIIEYYDLFNVPRHCKVAEEAIASNVQICIMCDSPHPVCHNKIFSGYCAGYSYQH